MFANLRRSLALAAAVFIFTQAAAQAGVTITDTVSGGVSTTTFKSGGVVTVSGTSTAKDTVTLSFDSN